MAIEINKISKSYDDHVVLDGVSLFVGPRSRIGLVGDNGAGKSTLLQIAQGAVVPDGGSVDRKKGVSVAYVPQVPDIDAGVLVHDMLVHPQIGIGRINEVLDMLGIPDVINKKFTELSGGQKTKIYLARIALQQADVLLLDEPTNHLDLQGLAWLESYLQRFKGGLVVISHDRFFLDSVTRETVELEQGQLSLYGGNYSFYHEQKQIETAAHRVRYQSQQKEIKRLKKSLRASKDEGNRKDADRLNTSDNDKYGQSFLAERASGKFHRASKNMESRLDHMDMVDKPEKETVLDIYFTPSGAKNSKVVSIENFDVAHDSLLFHVESLGIFYGNKVALQGHNGCGKTTLLRNILSHHQHDQIQVGKGVSMGYLSQEHGELPEKGTALGLLTAIPGIEITEAYKILSQVNISPTLAKQDFSTLSSGQKTKLLLAKIMAEGSNCILLDEPTNHLDFDSMDTIEQALRDFKGTLLVVSHDRYFLEQIGITKYLQVQDGRIAQS